MKTLFSFLCSALCFVFLSKKLIFLVPSCFLFPHIVSVANFIFFLVLFLSAQMKIDFSAQMYPSFWVARKRISSIDRLSKQKLKTSICRCVYTKSTSCSSDVSSGPSMNNTSTHSKIEFQSHHN